MGHMTENPEQMRGWMTSSEHAKEMTQIMRENNDFMMKYYLS